MELKIIVRTHPNRSECLAYLKKYLPPQTIYSNDQLLQGARWNMCNALSLAGNVPCLHMEDDIYLTKNFEYKIESTVQRLSDFVVQFYNQNPIDNTLGSRFQTKLLGMLCVYLPQGYSQRLFDFMKIWPDANKHKAGSDLALSAMLKAMGKPHYLVVPSAVQHRDIQSEIYEGKRNPRISSSFVEGIYE